MVVTPCYGRANRENCDDDDDAESIVIIGRRSDLIGMVNGACGEIDRDIETDGWDRTGPLDERKRLFISTVYRSTNKYRNS